MLWPFRQTESERAKREAARLELRNVNTLLERDAEIKELEQRIAQLEETLAIEQSKVRVRDAEIEELAAVVARNLRRVQAETDLLSPKE